MSCFSTGFDKLSQLGLKVTELVEVLSQLDLKITGLVEVVPESSIL